MSAPLAPTGERLTFASTKNGSTVEAIAGSYLHKHLREHNNGGTWQPVVRSTRSASVAVGVEFRNGVIVRDGDAPDETERQATNAMRPRFEQGVKPDGRTKAAREAKAAKAAPEESAQK